MEQYRKKTVSVVIPCYRSEHTLRGVIDELTEAMRGLSAYAYEVILVNDGSPDRVEEVIRALATERENVTGISFARNFGQHAALMAGLKEAKGEYIVCMDDDGQTPADEIGSLLAALEKGSDVVYAKYTKKMHSGFRNLGSRVNDAMTRLMLGKPKELYVSSYFAAKRFIIENVLTYEGAYPYVLGLILRTTKNIANVEVTHRGRSEGVSGYTLRKLFSLWMNGFTAFSILPLRLSTLIGGVCACAGFIYGVYTVVKRFINPAVPMGFSSLMSAVVFIGGMIMVMLGMIGEYVGRMYLSMNRTPQYVIREVYGHERSDLA